VIKKAGLTIAVAAAGMLAISPLAFAGDYDGGHGGGGWGGHRGHNSHSSHSSHSSHGPTQVQNGLVNLQDVADVNANACGNNIGDNILGILAGQTAVAGGKCSITEKGDGDATQVQNGLVNAQDVVDLNLNACSNNILDNVAGIASSQTALAAAKCKVTQK
jgi:hypothetical protein